MGVAILVVAFEDFESGLYASYLPPETLIYGFKRVKDEAHVYFRDEEEDDDDEDSVEDE